jgi:peptidoglycan/LPS O-acetylase OafA/YrhL
MRAVGVILVMTYHFFPSFLPGGFVGVDVFFVVSGYLITSLLVREFENNGRLRLLDFYRRRWRRLFPAIAAMLLVCLPLSLAIPADFRMGIARQAAAALSWVTNYYEIFTGQSYEAQLLPHLLIHTWTLSVEMQYYILWGAITAGVLFAASRFANARVIPARTALMLSALIIAAASFMIMRNSAAGTDDPSAAYMATQSHIFPLMIGSAFGCVCGFSPLPFMRGIGASRVFKVASVAFALLGICGIIFMSFEFSFTDPRVYSYGILLVSLVTAIILCLARAWQDASARREPRVLNYIGLRSYSIYLFHWPIMIIAGQLADGLGAPSLWGAAFGIPGTFIAAEFSYRWVEQRFRVRRRSAYGAGEIRIDVEPPDCVKSSSLRGASATKQSIFVAITGLLRSARKDNLHKFKFPHSLSSLRRAYRIAAVCAVMVLAIFSVNAVASAPRISSIEADLRYGAMSLDVSNIQSLHDEVIAEDENGE